MIDWTGLFACLAVLTGFSGLLALVWHREILSSWQDWQRPRQAAKRRAARRRTRR